MEEEFYVIQNGWSGNSMMFWREGRAGYTSDFDKVHKFTLVEARATARNDESIFDWNKLKELTTPSINPETRGGVWDAEIAK